MKRHQVKSEPQNIEGWVRFAQAFFNKIDRIPYFDIRYPLFDIRYSIFQSFFFDQSDCFFWQAAGPTADIRNLHFLATCRQIKSEKGRI